MNWTNISQSEKFDIESYRSQGFFDNGGLKLLPDYNKFARMEYEDFFKNIEKFLYGSDDMDILNLEEIMIVWCAFCKYFSYDSIFATLYLAKNRKSLFRKLKKILNTEYYEKIKYEDGGEYNRYVYRLTKKGLQYACELIPDVLQSAYMEEWKIRKKKSKGYVMHDCHGGTIFNNFIISKSMCCYYLEKKHDVNNTPEKYLRTDITIGIGSEESYYGIFVEQDTGSENPMAIMKKINSYCISGLINNVKNNVLMISYRGKIKGYFEKYFPFVFSVRCIENVYALLRRLQCDLLMLLCYCESKSYEMACELKRTKLVGGGSQIKWNHIIENDRVGLITSKEFCDICNYQGQKSVETLYMTVLCARSIYTMMNMPEVEQAFEFVCTEKNVILTKENGGLVIDVSILHEYKRICNDALCYNPFYLYLKNCHNQVGCIKRKNQLLMYLWKLYEEGKIFRYHEELLKGAEVMVVPTNQVMEYYPVLLPQEIDYNEKIKMVLKKYFYSVNCEAEHKGGFRLGKYSIELKMRNCFVYSLVVKDDEGIKNREFEGEIFVENTYVSIAALLRVKAFIQEYLNQNERNITIICVAHNFSDAINTALFLDYWEREDSIISLQERTKGGRTYLFKKKFNLCFVNIIDLINGKELNNSLYLVRRKVLENGHYAGEGYGYASTNGIYHCSPDGSCVGFYKEALKAPF